MRKRRQKVKRGKQYRTEKQDAHARPGNENAKRGGNESQKHCPRDSEKTAEKIAAVAGVSPRTIKNDAHFAEAVDVLVADSVPMATRSLILSGASLASRPGNKTLHQDAKNPPPDKPMMG